MAEVPDVTARLKAVPLFAGFTERQLKTVVQAGKRVEFPAGKEVTREGEEGVGFHLILEGGADVLVGGSVVNTLGPDDYFGEISLLDGKPRSATVRITAPTTTYSLAAWDFSRVLDANPEVMRPLLVELCRRLRAAESPGAET